MNVLKFGGTSMKDDTTWRRILDIIARYEKPVVVVSATSHTTRQLVSAAKLAVSDRAKAHKIAKAIRDRHCELIENFMLHSNSIDTDRINKKCKQWIDARINNLLNLLTQIADKQKVTPVQNDAVTSIGEQLSAYLFAQCGQAHGLSTRWVDAQNIIKTDASFGRAVPDRPKIDQTISAVSQLVDDNFIPVMGGFYGSDADGRITTLGFEGSDYTASLLGAHLQAKGVEIWTDVSGVYTCDPRVVSTARPIAELSYREATELAYFGAKVLHPSTMKPAAAVQIPVKVKNIFEPEQPGTVIHHQKNGARWATAITHAKDITLVTVNADQEWEGHHFLSAVFHILQENQRSAKAVTTTEASVSLALENTAVLDNVVSSFKKVGTVNLQAQQGLVSVVGCRFSNVKEIEEKVFSGIDDFTPSLVSYSKSKQNLNIALDETDLIPAVCRIHDTLFAHDH